VAEGVEGAFKADAGKGLVVSQGGGLHDVTDDIVGDEVHVEFACDHVEGAAAKDFHAEEGFEFAEVQLDGPALVVEFAEGFEGVELGVEEGGCPPPRRRSAPESWTDTEVSPPKKTHPSRPSKTNWRDDPRVVPLTRRLAKPETRSPEFLRKRHRTKKISSRWPPKFPQAWPPKLDFRLQLKSPIGDFNCENARSQHWRDLATIGAKNSGKKSVIPEKKTPHKKNLKPVVPKILTSMAAKIGLPLTIKITDRWF
jgi:hypothetical protein